MYDAFLSSLFSSQVELLLIGSCVGGPSAFNPHLDTRVVHTTSAY